MTPSWLLATALVNQWVGTVSLLYFGDLTMRGRGLESIYTVLAIVLGYSTDLQVSVID